MRSLVLALVLLARTAAAQSGTPAAPPLPYDTLSLTLATVGGLLAGMEPPGSLEEAAIRGWLTATVPAGVVALPASRRLQADAFRTIRADVLRLS